MIAVIITTVAFIAIITVVGTIYYLVKQNAKFAEIAKQNETILELLQKNETQVHQDETLRQCDSDDELTEDYRLPYFTDSEEEDMESLDGKALSLPGTSSSGYDTESGIDWDWEIYKIQRCPPGPVPHEQVLLILDCPRNDCYVKAITDEQESLVHIVAYMKMYHQKYEWVESTCQECIDKVKMVMTEGGNQIPFAVDLEEDESVEDEQEEEDEVVEEDVVEEEEVKRVRPPLVFDADFDDRIEGIAEMMEFDFSTMFIDDDYLGVMLEE